MIKWAVNAWCFQLTAAGIQYFPYDLNFLVAMARNQKKHCIQWLKTEDSKSRGVRAPILKTAEAVLVQFNLHLV